MIIRLRVSCLDCKLGRKEDIINVDIDSLPCIFAAELYPHRSECSDANRYWVELYEGDKKEASQ